MRRALTYLLVLCAYASFAQEGMVPLEHFSSTFIEASFQDSLHKIHPEVKPYSYWSVQRFAQLSDTSKRYEALALKRVGKTYLRVTPRVGVRGFSQGGSEFKQGYFGYVGAGAGMAINNKLYISGDFIFGRTDPASYMGEIIDSLSVVPGYGFRYPNGPNRDFKRSGFMVAWKPAPYLELFAGRGKHFIGEGYRSVFLSDYAPNYNYGRIDLNVWRLKYMVLYSQFKQSENYPKSFNPTMNKYATMHYLSLNVTSWWTIGAFESIIWESEDSVINREFDISYANPVIFFRPVEYGMGSSDNAILGFSSSIRPAKGWTLYSQFMLDEFLFGEYTAPIKKKLSGDNTIPTGYWANKQSYQLGVKAFEPFGWKGGSVLAEVNAVRPFTYGHSNRNQSYTHLNQPLAHPLGANFIEWVQVTTWQPDRWRVGVFTTYARKGYSNQQYFMGEDPLISNTERNQNEREHGNFMLQGRRVDVANIQATVGYIIVESWDLKLESLLHYRLERTASERSDMVIFGLGLKTALWNDEQNL